VAEEEPVYSSPRLPQLVTLLASIWEKLGSPDMVAPLGLKHPDHQLVAAACRRLAPQLWAAGKAVWVYEELPGRVLWPELVRPALDLWEAHLLVNLEPCFIGSGPMELKLEALSCYSSQLPLLEGMGSPCCWQVPERFWA
jgi:LmbE family N-acetylglucosaminyl deacetylase